MGTRDYTEGGNDGTALAKLVMATSPISDQDRDNFMEDDHYNYAFVRSLGLHSPQKKRSKKYILSIIDLSEFIAIILMYCSMIQIIGDGLQFHLFLSVMTYRLI